MPICFIRVATEPGQERPVQDRLAACPEVSSLRPVYGEYDFYVDVAAESYDALARFVTHTLAGMPGVRTVGDVSANVLLRPVPAARTPVEPPPQHAAPVVAP